MSLGGARVEDFRVLQGASDVLGGIVGFWDLKVAHEEYAGSDGSEAEGV